MLSICYYSWRSYSYIIKNKLEEKERGTRRCGKEEINVFDITLIATANSFMSQMVNISCVA